MSTQPGSYSCRCPAKYSGTNCEVQLQVSLKKGEILCIDDYWFDFIKKFVYLCKQACLSNPCVNNGTCVELTGSVNTYGYVCQCSAGYTGNKCQTLIDVCASSPCVYGTCSQLAPNVFQCVCRAGYNGPRCEVDINECLSSPCQNGICSTPFPNMYS